MSYTVKLGTQCLVTATFQSSLALTASWFKGKSSILLRFTFIEVTSADKELV